MSMTLTPETLNELENELAQMGHPRGLKYYGLLMAHAPALIAAARENQKLREMVRWLEWTSEVVENKVIATCPFCRHRQNEGEHSPSCELAALLGGE